MTERIWYDNGYGKRGWRDVGVCQVESRRRAEWFWSNHEILTGIFRDLGGKGNLIPVGSVWDGRAVTESDIDVRSFIGSGIDRKLEAQALSQLHVKLDSIGIELPFRVSFIGVKLIRELKQKILYE